MRLAAEILFKRFLHELLGSFVEIFPFCFAVLPLHPPVGSFPAQRFL